MANTIKIKRGLSSNISNITLAQGELAITTDTNELYAGTANGNVKLNDSNTDEIISIGKVEPTSPSVQLWIEDDTLNNIGTEVVDSLEGNEIDKASSVRAVKEKLSGISTTKPKFPFLYYYQQGNLKIIKYAEYGMTYQDWINSSYDSTDFSIIDERLYYQQLQKLSYLNDQGYPKDTYVKSSDFIVPGVTLAYTCCFIAGSQILISLDGKTKNIETLKDGDPIVIYNESEKKFEMSVIDKLIIKPNVTDQAQVILEDGTFVTMNAYHPLLTVEGYHSITNYKELPTLTENDILITTKGQKKIKQIIRTKISPTTMYNLSVMSEHHNFIVNSIVAHNASEDPCMGTGSDHD